MDALAHITCGPDNHWNGGKSADTLLGDFGPLEDDASALPLLVTRGVLVDVAKYLGQDRLPKGYPISLQEFTDAMTAQGVHVGPGDVVCIRTGQMRAWPSREEWAKTAGAGITLPVAEMLLDAGALALGSDTEAVECMPSGDPEHPHPVHTKCLIEEGKHLIENMFLESLAADGVHEFMFFASAPRISGATGSFVRPVAIV
jgi:kynurenine formamidase